MEILACWTMLGLKVTFQTLFSLVTAVVMGTSDLAGPQRQEVCHGLTGSEPEPWDGWTGCVFGVSGLLTEGNSVCSLA